MTRTNGPPHYLRHRARLRERFKKTSLEGLQDYEILELLLTFAIPRKDTKPTAKKLLERFGSLSALLDAQAGELESVPGIGPRSSTLIKLVKAMGAHTLGERMKKKDFLASPGMVVDFARAKLGGLPYESFMVVYLNVKNEVLGHEVLQEGTVDHAAVYPRRIVESSLAHHASGLVLVHNHPSGHCEPSKEDEVLTRTLSEAVRAVEIQILDHIIVGRSGHFSFAEKGLLNKGTVIGT